MRYKNPTPNPLPASDEGAMMYFIIKECAVFGQMAKNETSQRDVFSLTLVPSINN
jgi:hypothetical protein